MAVVGGTTEVAGTSGRLGELARSAWFGPVAVAAVALVARVLYWVLVLPSYAPESDAGNYHEIAGNLAAGRGFAQVYPQLETHPTAFRPPLYPFVLGAAYRVLGTHVPVGRALNVAIGVAVVVLAFLLARRLGGTLAGWVAGGVAAVYPPLLANDTVLLTEPLSLALLLGMLLCFAHRRWLPAAGLCGLLVLSRPSAQYVVLLVLVWVVWQFGWRRALASLGVVVLVVAPWVVRNWVQVGSPVLVTSNGYNWAAIYSPQAQQRDTFVDPAMDPSFDDYGVAQFDEVEWQRQLQDLAFRNLRRDPAQVLHVVGRNALSYFELDPASNDNAERLDGRNLDFRSATLPAFYVVTVAGLAGLLWRWRHPVVLLALGILAYFVVTSLVLISAPRLRGPVDVLCCVGAGLLAATIVERTRRTGGGPGPRGRPPIASAP